MGEARLTLLGVLLAASLGGSAGATAQSRFVSYSTEGQCIAGHLFADALCKSAFASARAEFEARTPSFASLGQCAKSYGSCAAWPPGSPSKASFRPRWDGVDIVDTPHEKTVTPAAAAGPRKLSFAPLPLNGPSEFRNLTVRGAGQLAGRFAPLPPGRMGVQHAVRSPERPGPAGPSAPPPPGSGFKLEDGVLTYPAPARFAPKNLPKQP